MEQENQGQADGTAADRVQQLSDERGWREPTRRDRLGLRIREALHPLGFHHRVRIFSYDEALDRLIDLGVACRTCGR